MWKQEKLNRAGSFRSEGEERSEGWKGEDWMRLMFVLEKNRNGSIKRETEILLGFRSQKWRRLVDIVDGTWNLETEPLTLTVVALNSYSSMFGDDQKHTQGKSWTQNLWAIWEEGLWGSEESKSLVNVGTQYTHRLCSNFYFPKAEKVQVQHFFCQFFQSGKFFVWISTQISDQNLDRLNLDAFHVYSFKHLVPPGRKERKEMGWSRSSVTRSFEDVKIWTAGHHRIPILQIVNFELGDWRHSG